MPLPADDIARLYRVEGRRMTGFLVRRTHDPEVAVDLVAETFASALEDRAQFRGDGDADAIEWLYAIARNLLNGWYRRGEVRQRAVARLGIERPDLGEGEVERLIELGGLAEVRAQFVAGLGALPEDQRRAVLLRVVDECSYPEASRLLGVTQQVARARVSRGLRALAAVLRMSDTEEGR
jgi:RNA polymerase sigma-70 factor (ECF subfamily)